MALASKLALMSSEEIFHTFCDHCARFELFNMLNDAVLIFDATTGSLLFINSRARSLYGYEKDQTLTSGFADFANGKFNILRDVKQAGPEGLIYSAVHRRVSGEMFKVQVSAKHLKLHGVHAVVLLVRDFTADMQATEELGLAGKIQRGFLPPPFQNEWLTVRTIFEPWRMVSGDLFDYEWDEENQVLSGLVADVMGHGMGAALQTSAFKVLFRQVVSYELSPAQKLYWMNDKSMPYLQEDSLIAAVCFELDLRKKILRCVAGGINKYLVVSGGKSKIHQVPGSLLGVSQSPEFEEVSVPVGQGDSFFFMSDGLTDLLTALPDAAGYSDMVDLLERLSQSSRRRDDISAVCINVNKTL